MEITSKRLGTTAVVDNMGVLIGIITDGDLRRMLEKNTNIEKIKANNIMSKNPKTIKHNKLAVLALEMMRKQSITQLIVVDDSEKYLGVIHIHDLIREGFV